MRRNKAAAYCCAFLLVCALVAIAVWFAVGPQASALYIIVPALCVLNLTAFVLYAFDKYRAKNAGDRVKETTLLAVLWTAGCIGAWVAMLLVRHKTRKCGFLLPAFALTIVNPIWLAVWAFVKAAEQA